MSSPDLRQLRYFVAVAEELHFGRAAERVGIAQPPLTQQIQKLEAALDCPLFIRGRKTTLTEAGAVLLEQSRRLLEQADLVLEITRRAGRGETGSLTVGVPPSVMLSPLPHVIGKFRRRFPGVAFTLRERSTSAIEDAVRSGELDLGFLRETTPAMPLTGEVVLREPVVLVLPAARRALTLRAARTEPFVLFPRRLGPALYDRLIAAGGFTPNIVQEATQWQTVVAFVAAGAGISLAPGGIRKLRWPGVVYRPIPGSDTVVRACWRSGDPSPTLAAFLAHLRPALRT